MPGWLTHLRVAQASREFLDFAVDEENYWVGTIATDCGKICHGENGRVYYDPPRTITHWTDGSSGIDYPIHFTRFYETCVRDKAAMRDARAKSFYFGYYLHLVTDAVWIEAVSRPFRARFAAPEQLQPAWKRFKREWYWADLRYIRAHPGYQPLRRLRAAGERLDRAYLDYAPPALLREKIDECLAAYAPEVPAPPAPLYFTDADYEAAVAFEIQWVRMQLLSR